MMQESLCWQETHSSSVSRANSLAAGKSTASRQPSRESAGGSSSGANVVENYNYDAAPVHHGGGQRGQLQGISRRYDRGCKKSMQYVIEEMFEVIAPYKDK